MPDLESIPDTDAPHAIVPLPHPPHAARVEDVDEDDEEVGEHTHRRTLPSGRSILRHVDSDEEDDDIHRLHVTPPVQPFRPPQPLTAPQLPSTSTTSQPSSDQEFRDPQRLQRWLLTTGLTGLQSNPKNSETLKMYIDRLRLLGSKQQDWIIRMVKQRAGDDVESKVREAIASSS